MRLCGASAARFWVEVVEIAAHRGVCARAGGARRSSLVEPLGCKGSGRLEQRQGPRRCARWGAGRSVQVGEDLADHLGMGDCGDDLQARAIAHCGV